MNDIAEQSAKALAGVLAFYKSKGCPCAFPRFFQLACFDFRHFGTGPVGCHLTDIMIDLAVTGPTATYKLLPGDEEKYRCAVCGTEGTIHSEQFNIHMWITVFKAEPSRARQLGHAADARLPIPGGLYGFKQEDMDRTSTYFGSGTVQEMVDYLMEMGG